MRKTFFLTTVFISSFIGGAFEASDSSIFGQESLPQIFVNNRILAKVNGNPISAIDLMKKMDMMFYRQFPQYTSSVEIRHQFYQVNWKHVLQDLIDKELVLADAEEHEIKITHGDIRQEMENLFGPNIIVNLDKIGLTFDEAWKMVRGDLIIRRMIYYRANSKAINKITPQTVREAYVEYAKNNIRPEEWIYRVISIRDSDSARCAEAANFIYGSLVEEGVSLEELPSCFVASPYTKVTKVSISEEFHHEEKDLSPAYKEVIIPLKSGEYSLPVVQKSRNDQGSVFRIFYLKEYLSGGAVSFSEVENKIKELLLDEAINKETEAYLLKMRRHFNVQEGYYPELSSGEFQPFILK